MYEQPINNDNHVEDPSKRELMKKTVKALGGLAAFGALGAFGTYRFNKREQEMDAALEKSGEEIIDAKIHSIEELIRNIGDHISNIDPNDPQAMKIEANLAESKAAFLSLLEKRRSNETLKIKELEDIEKEMLQDQLRLMEILR